MNLNSPQRPLKPHRPNPILTPVGRIAPAAGRITPPAGRSQTSKRRSSRMALHARISLSGQDRMRCAFNLMPAKATSLNRHGAAVQLQRELLVGSTVVVKNQRGTMVSARVVAQLAAFQGIPTYAIEFLEQDEKAKNFWGITFPSSNAE
jgi:hypothetical protein